MGTASTSPSHEQIVASLIARWPESHPQPSLERIEALCDLLGSVHRACPVIQITGTNGKGSTAIMIESILRAQGLRTGRFSSPHLSDVTERICIDGEAISHDRFDELWHQIEPLVAMVDSQELGGVPMTFFEIMTAMAYAAFADAPVDVAIVEVGMGGRWDATSVAHPAVSVITPIDFDHTHLLGETLEQIAYEKAGIIKEGSCAVMAAQDLQAAKVLIERCAATGVKAVCEGVDFALLATRKAVGGQMITINTPSGRLDEIYLPLIGEHMARNAALAVAAVHSFYQGRLPSDEILADGLSSVKADGRIELIDSQPALVIDTAHNPHGVRATLEAVESNYLAQPLIVVLGMMADKAVDDVVQCIAQSADMIIATTIVDNERALGAEALAHICSEYLSPARVESASDPVMAVEKARHYMLSNGCEDGLILVVGSVYLAGYVRDHCYKANERITISQSE